MAMQVPPPAEIRARLTAAVAEARALRRLLRLAEAAERAEQARAARQPGSEEEHGRPHGEAGRDE
jgi:hypothetical protein